MNLYRGCTHGCIYCDSRSHCYQMEHDFEDVEVKQNAVELLEHALRRKRKACMISTGAMSDPYIYEELDVGLTRRALETIAAHGFGLCIQTKSTRILRDLDLLSRIHKQAKCVVEMTLTTVDEQLCRIVEPNVSTTAQRFEALKILDAAGIPTVVWISPILPYINDTEENLRGLLAYCREANVKGVICFGMSMTLREGNREYYYAALDRHFPGFKEKYHAKYGRSYVLMSERNQALMDYFHAECESAGILHDNNEIFSYLSHLPNPLAEDQLSFDLLTGM